MPAAPGPPSKDADDVVVLPVIPWSYRRQRPQHLAEALARRGRRVFYGSVAGSGEPREPAGAAPGVTLLPIDGPRREDLPQAALAGRSLRRCLASLEWARARFSVTRATLLVQSPFWAPLAAALQERHGWHVVYDCLDAHTEFSTNRAGALADAERSLASGADVVAATSEPLRRRLAERNASARLLPNACAPADYAGVAALVPRAGRLTVGYAGAVDEWFDAELLDRLAALAPDWRFEIVGGLEGEGPAPPARGNVVFHGERPYREMPGFRARFDVEIIPFRLSPLTHATDPVKLYEAAAAGRPVVATPMDALAPLARLGMVRLAATPEEFVRAISAAASDAREPETVARLRSFAAENSWDVRAAALDSWILNLPPRAARGPVPEPA